MSDALLARTVMITGDGGDEIEAYLVTPEPPSPSPRGGVVVIHHMPGYNRGMKELTRRFAELGYDTICPNLHYRDAPGADPDDAAAANRANGGVSDDQLLGDVGAAMAYLRELPSSNGRIGCIGYCSGGRQSVLAACHLDLDAAIDCYGAFVTGEPPADFPIPVTNLVDDLPNLRSPLLGLFGNDDKYPSPEHVDDLERRLADLGKPFEVHRYPDTGHGFFSADRPNFRVAASNDGWLRIEDFFAAHLTAGAAPTRES